jgi:membrane protease YdiL (CAAX protease family)
MRDPRLTALVGVDGFMSGVVEDLVFRALIFLAFVQAWGRSRSAIVKAAVVSSIFFALPHLTNMLFGQQPLRVFAQVGWAFVLGIAIAWFYYAGASIWPAAFLHGALDAIVATNRMGLKIAIIPAKGLVMFKSDGSGLLAKLEWLKSALASFLAGGSSPDPVVATIRADSH